MPFQKNTKYNNFCAVTRTESDRDGGNRPTQQKFFSLVAKRTGEI
jgi:hypothetical protein